MGEKRIVGANDLTVDKIGTIEEHIVYLDDTDRLNAFSHAKAIGWLILEDKNMSNEEKIDKLDEIFNIPNGIRICITKDNFWGLDVIKEKFDYEKMSERFKLMIMGDETTEETFKEMCGGSYKTFDEGR